MELPLDLIVNSAMENEVLFSIKLLKMVHLADPIRLVNLVICLRLKSMRAHLELAQGIQRACTQCWSV